MAGYPHSQPGYGYGPPPPNPYGAAQQPYGAAPQPYGYDQTKPGKVHDPNKPPKENKPMAAPGGYLMGAPNPYGAAQQPYGAAPAPAQPYGAAPQPYGYDQTNPGKVHDPNKPPKENKPMAAPGGYPTGAPGGYPASGGYPTAPAPGGYGSPFASLMPSTFPPGTDPNVVAGFQAADQDRSGFIDDNELQRALSGFNQSFSIRTVHLLMYLFTNTNARKIGPKEFTSVFYSLQNWRGIFERFDMDRSGKIDARELSEALQSLGYSVSPVVLELLVSKFDKKGGKDRAIEYDNFIECCLTVKGLTEKFKEKDTMYSGSATFSYEVFMLTVLPFLIS